MSKNRRQAGESKHAETKAGIRKTRAVDASHTRRAAIVLGVMVTMIFSLGALASWRSLPVGSNAAPTNTPPPMPASAPGKEYIYAGSALISTVEAFRQLPNDVAVWRPSTGYWYILNSQQQLLGQQWGISTDKPAPGDFDGDGKTDFCVFRPDNPSTSTDECQNGCSWYIIHSSSGATDFPVFGDTNDIPAVADFDGDGKSDLALWRPSNQYWYIKKSSSGATVQVQFGSSGDITTPADFDGDGRADFVIWRNSTATFWVQKSTDGTWMYYSIGQTGDTPVVGDYDGDGKADYAVRGASDNIWRIRYSTDGNVYNQQWGVSSDIVVPARYNDSDDGDSKTDVAVWRPSTGVWYILRSSNGTMRATQFGAQGDIPVPAAWRR